LEKDVDELKQFHKKTVGIPPSTGNVHYSTSSQEFGEYSLDEMDTFNFIVSSSLTSPSIYTYSYNLENPTDELRAYLSIQNKTFSSGSAIPINPDNFEKYCMEQKGTTPFVLTNEIRKCLESRIWTYSSAPLHYNHQSHQPDPRDKSIKLNFSEDIEISFKNTYQIFPHVSFYITPIEHPGITCSIKEITCKHVTFTVVNNTPKQQIPEDLTLHYHVNGIVEQSPVGEFLN
jgi:hypothetical protein